jgi:hypothetical protein
MFKRLFAGLAMAALLTAVQSARAGILFATDFEAPTYTTGLLAGQDGWLSDIGSAFVSVQDGIAESGTQAVQIAATDTTPAFSRGFHQNFFDTAASSLKTIQLSVDMLIESPGMGGTASVWWPLNAFNSNGTPIASMRVGVAGNLLLGTTPTGVTVSKDVWNSYQMELDFATGTMDGFLNGVLVASDAPFNNSNPAYRYGAVSLGGTVGTDRAFFDNLAVAAVPEPYLPRTPQHRPRWPRLRSPPQAALSRSPRD